jgi:hypothetical protein
MRGCSVPLAPPHTLVLTASTFMPFKRTQENQPTADHLRTTGARLALRDGGASRQRAFEESTFAAALGTLLRHESWAAWRDSLEHAVVDKGKLGEWLGCYDAWQERLARKRAVQGAWKQLAPVADDSPARVRRRKREN